MKISLVIILVIFAISLTFTIVGLVAFDLSVNEIKELLGARNQGFAVNMIQGLDKHIENRIFDFQALTNLELIHMALKDSNKEFQRIQDIKAYLNIKEQEISYSESTPFIGNELEKILTEELSSIIRFYHDEYNYDVVEELFITNAYGANVALATGTSDYMQSDEEWWQITKENGQYLGKIHYDKNYETHSIDFAFRIDDSDGNFLGVLRVVINLDSLLTGFAEETGIITIQGRDVLLLDGNGNTIYSHEQISISESSLPYFQKIKQGPDIGFFELEDKVDDFLLISYAKSTGYRTFAGFSWVAVVEQNSSSIVQEFIVLRDSILAVSIAGMIASVIGGLLISTTVSSPLKQLTRVAHSISRGNFDVKINKSRIDEIRTISQSFEEMSQDLQKLIDTEKKLAEADVKIKKERLVAIGELAASMAHDLKNPLAIIKSSSDILQKNVNLDSELQEVVNRMNRAIDRMSHQINDVLNFVRKTPLDTQQVNVTEILEKAKSSLKIPENISLSIPTSEIKIIGDPRKLEVVFINLFLNSIQAIGNNPGKIHCSINKKNNHVEIVIEDTGSGIPESIFTRIFDPLVTSKHKGTGLGLSTCKNIIEQHNGTISAKNNPTQFTISLPQDLTKKNNF